MLVLLFTRIRVTELKIFMIFNHIILSSKHLLVQTQQKKHQKKVWNMFGVNNKNARKASMSCLFLVFHFEQVNVSCSLGLWRLVINFWNSININVFFFSDPFLHQEFLFIRNAQVLNHFTPISRQNLLWIYFFVIYRVQVCASSKKSNKQTKKLTLLWLRFFSTWILILFCYNKYKIIFVRDNSFPFFCT